MPVEEPTVGRAHAASAPLYGGPSVGPRCATVPALVTQERRSEAVLLKDAPLDVRERFLRRSEEFFREYLKLCEDRLGSMNGSVATADAKFSLLENVLLE